MATKPERRIARIVHEAADDAHKAGVMDKTTKRTFDVLCLAKVLEPSPKEIQALRERENVSQAVLARDHRADQPVGTRRTPPERPSLDAARADQAQGA
jgi:DNA-binding transcriptional regulator YiaG